MSETLKFKEVSKRIHDGGCPKCGKEVDDWDTPEVTGEYIEQGGHCSSCNVCFHSSYKLCAVSICGHDGEQVEIDCEEEART